MNQVDPDPQHLLKQKLVSYFCGGGPSGPGLQRGGEAEPQRLSVDFRAERATQTTQPQHFLLQKENLFSRGNFLKNKFHLKIGNMYKFTKLLMI